MGFAQSAALGRLVTASCFAESLQGSQNLRRIFAEVFVQLLLVQILCKVAQEFINMLTLGVHLRAGVPPETILGYLKGDFGTPAAPVD